MYRSCRYSAEVSASPTGADDRAGVVSPELVLVDPLLRKRLLTPPQQGDGQAEEDRPGRAGADVHSAAPDGVDHRALPVPEAAAPPAPQRRPRLALIGLASAAAFVLGAKLASPSYVTPPQAVASTAAGGLSSSTGPRGTVTRPTRRLSWAPVSGATGYEVAIYSRTGRVFAAHTSVPQVAVPLSGGLRRPAGRLIWYVWPVRAGVRATTPVVDSELPPSP
jgi:hypothetical protein